MRPVKDATASYMANGQPATRGVCPTCGTGLFKIGATPAHERLPKPEVAPRSQVKKETRKLGNKETGQQVDKANAAAFPSAPLTGEAQAYCVKCKVMRSLKNGRAIFMANARPAAEGVCGECGTQLVQDRRDRGSCGVGETGQRLSG